MNSLSLALASFAGVLTTLSPCILPVLPFVTASSLSKSKWGPFFLALGLLFAFVSLTLVISVSGQLFGLDQELLKKGAAVLLAASGITFLVPPLQDWLTLKASGLTGFAGRGQALLARTASGSGEFLSGLLLGIVWSPCSGPSLGVALGLATKAGGAGPAAVLLLFFGLGAVTPLLLLAYGAKGLAQKLRAQSGLISWFKKGLGLLMLGFGFLILTGLDRTLESSVTNLLPESFIQFTTKY